MVSSVGEGNWMEWRGRGEEKRRNKGREGVIVACLKEVGCEGNIIHRPLWSICHLPCSQRFN